MWDREGSGKSHELCGIGKSRASRMSCAGYLHVVSPFWLAASARAEVQRAPEARIGANLPSILRVRIVSETVDLGVLSVEGIWHSGFHWPVDAGTACTVSSWLYGYVAARQWSYSQLEPVFLNGLQQTQIVTTMWTVVSFYDLQQHPNRK